MIMFRSLHLRVFFDKQNWIHLIFYRCSYNSKLTFKVILLKLLNFYQNLFLGNQTGISVKTCAIVMGSASGAKISLVSIVEGCIQSFPDITAWKHKSEPQVKQLISFDEVKSNDEDSKASKKKMKFSLIDQLKKKGTHVHNMAVLSKGKGELVVEKRPSEGSKKGYTEFLPCEYCFGWYYRKDLHRHIKLCTYRIEEPSSKKGSNRIQSFASMMLPVDEKISGALHQIFQRMKQAL